MPGGLGADGGMAPYMLIPSARHLLPLRTIDPVAAAPLTDAGLTPYHAIKRSLDRMGPGSTTVVIGAGGLGHMAVQILAAICATRVVAVDTRAEALALAAKRGADHTVVAGDTAADEIRDITRGLGADVVLDFVGNDATMALAVAASRMLGHITIVGLGGGSYPLGFFTVPYEAQVATTYWGSIPELMEVLELAEAGHIGAEIHRYDLDGAAGAYEDLAQGKLTGRAVIVPG